MPIAPLVCDAPNVMRNGACSCISNEVVRPFLLPLFSLVETTPDDGQIFTAFNCPSGLKRMSARDYARARLVTPCSLVVRPFLAIEHDEKLTTLQPIYLGVDAKSPRADTPVHSAAALKVRPAFTRALTRSDECFQQVFAATNKVAYARCAGIFFAV